MYIVTFYSYRGGVGRTTALANVAVDLALRGRNVLVVDFDLEAPSLSNLAELRSQEPHSGLVEFVDEYLNANRAPAVKDYLYEVPPISKGSGKLWVMPAGREDEDYGQARARIDWQDLYVVRDGFLLFEDLKLQWEACLKPKPDYVLIDARAGVHGTTGVCTRQLPDAVVMMFAPDPATVSDPTGFHRVLADIYAESDDQGPGRIELHLVAGKTPDLDGEDLMLGNLEEPAELERIFDLAAEIPLATHLLRDTQLVLWPNPQTANEGRNRLPLTRLACAYRRLVDVIITGNCTQDPDGVRAFLKQVYQIPERAIESVDESPNRWENYGERLNQIRDHFKGDAAILGQVASCLFRAGRVGEAMSVLGEALDLAPGDSALRWQQFSYRRKVRHPGAIEDLLKLLDSPVPADWDLQQLIDDLARQAGHREPLAYAPLVDTLVEPLDDEVPGADRYVVSALRWLRRLKPDQMENALRKPCVERISKEALQLVLSDEPAAPVIAEKDPFRLIQWGYWRQAIALLEPHVRAPASPDLSQVFNLAMAFWGAGENDRATELCRTAAARILGRGGLEHFEREELAVSHVVAAQLLCLMFWKAGEFQHAKELVNHLLGELNESFKGRTFCSYWRYRTVTYSQFKAHCEDLHQMINGASILPPFLRKAPGE